MAYKDRYDRTIDEVRVGSKVYVTNYFGLATVTEVSEDINNNIPGIEYTGENGYKCWAYIDQVTEIIEY